MKGHLTEIVSADLCTLKKDVDNVVETLHDLFPDADIRTDEQYVFFYMELKNLEYTYYPQTYYEPSEFDCDDWIYEEDLEEIIIKISNDLGIDIDISEIKCEQKENEYE